MEKDLEEIKRQKEVQEEEHERMKQEVATLRYVTPPNFMVCARRKVPAKRFKICYILHIGIRKPKDAFSIFHFMLFCFFFPNECSGLCQHRPGHSLGKNIK